MCSDSKCKARADCYRYLARPEWAQAYKLTFRDPPPSKKDCRWQIPFSETQRDPLFVRECHVVDKTHAR